MVSVVMNNVYKATSALMLFLIMMTFNVQAAGGIALGATRVIYPADARQTSLAITNSNSKERFLVNAWIENDQGQKEKNFVVTPLLFTSEPKSENTLRIIYAGPALPTDRESIFWMNVKAIPSVDKSNVEGKNVLQLAVLSRIKLFVRPKNLRMQPEDALKEIRFAHGAGYLKVSNSSPYYVSLVNLKIGNTKLPNTMVAPKHSVQVAVPAGVQGEVTFQTVNDYGAVTKPQAGIMQ